MKNLFKKFETVMMAAAFAEEGEFETARMLLKEDSPRINNRPTTQTRPTDRKVLRAD